MNPVTVQLLDLPNEILLLILKKLDNIDVLYSLFGINKRFNLLIENYQFTNDLKLVSTSSSNHVSSLGGGVLDRFFMEILPKINHSIKNLVLEPLSMENILNAANYPNLSALEIYNFNKSVVSSCFTDESFYQHIFKEQITTRTLMINEDVQNMSRINYTKHVYEYILTFFKHLKVLDIIDTIESEYPSLSLCDLPSTTFNSSTLTKLTVKVNNFEDCLCLLDGRLKQLNTLVVKINNIANHSSITHNMDNLPKLKCFSLTCFQITYEYNHQILPLLRHLSYLEQLVLYLWIDDGHTLIDGNHVYNEILIHMPRLEKFIFYIRNYTSTEGLVRCLSNDDIQLTFTNIGYKNVACFIHYMCGQALCHVFSLPFKFNCLPGIGDTFSNIVFSNVTHLWVCDTIPFEYKFFIRVTQCFPYLKSLHVTNAESPSLNHVDCQCDRGHSYSIIEYPHLASLDIIYSHFAYVEQFLLDTKTSSPRLTKLKVAYETLKTVTQNFTRDATRFNCL